MNVYVVLQGITIFREVSEQQRSIDHLVLLSNSSTTRNHHDCRKNIPFSLRLVVGVVVPRIDINDANGGMDCAFPGCSEPETRCPTNKSRIVLYVPFWKEEEKGRKWRGQRSQGCGQDAGQAA